MKRFTTILIALFTVFTMGYAGNDKVISADKLPAQAQSFIKTHFPKSKIMLATVDNDIVSKTYDVVLKTGENIEFDGKGNWKEIECKTSQVPSAVIPEQILNYVKTNYPETVIKEISKDRRDYEVKLSNRIELKFDLNFNLIEIDL